MITRTLLCLMVQLWAAGTYAQIHWPILPFDTPHPVLGTLGELRGDSLAACNIRLHNGVDIAAPDGTNIYVVEAGMIEPPQLIGEDGEYIRIGRFVYVHMDEIDGDLIARMNEGLPADRGMRVGTTNDLRHLHLVTGYPGFYSNALAELQNYVDMSPPNPVTGIRLFDADAGTELPLQSGRYMLGATSVEIRAKASDRQDDPGSQETGVFKIGYRVIGRSPGSTYDTGEIFKISFGTLPTQDPQWVYSPDATGAPCANNFIYIPTDAVDSADSFDPTVLEAGEYEFRVIAMDIAGNRAESSIIAVKPSAACPERTVCGTVKDAETGTIFLEGIGIELRDARGVFRGFTRSDSSGGFAFPNLMDPSYILYCDGFPGLNCSPTQPTVVPGGPPMDFRVLGLPAYVTVTAPVTTLVVFTPQEWFGPPPCLGAGCPPSVQLFIGVTNTVRIVNGTWWYTCYPPPTFAQTSSRQLILSPNQRLTVSCPP